MKSEPGHPDPPSEHQRRFEAFVRGVLAVPKPIIDARHIEYERKQAQLPRQKKKGRVNPLSGKPNCPQR